MNGTASPSYGSGLYRVLASLRRPRQSLVWWYAGEWVRRLLALPDIFRRRAGGYALMVSWADG